MSTIKDGGPAFPSKKRIFRDGYRTDDFEPVNGMTLRDYFAATVELDLTIKDRDLASQIVGRAFQGDDAFYLLQLGFDMEARLRYMKADAMLAARKANPQK